SQSRCRSRLCSIGKLENTDSFGCGRLPQDILALSNSKRDDPLFSATSPSPIQYQRCLLGILRPVRDVFFLESGVALLEVTIEQIGDFAGSAWFLDFVQRSRNVLAQTTIRVSESSSLGKKNFRGNRHYGV